jgi:hypothetical protein
MGQQCTCYMCQVASLYGGPWNAWTKTAGMEQRKAGAVSKESNLRRCANCFALIKPD